MSFPSSVNKRTLISLIFSDVKSDAKNNENATQCLLCDDDDDEKSNNCLCETRSDADVLILGAGLAGLGAALKLKQAGHLSFLLLEGQHTVGGRVNTLNMLSNPNLSTTVVTENNHPSFVDAGAQWLHGKFNALHDISHRAELLSGEQSEEGLGTFIRDDGYVFDEYLVNKVDFIVGKILTECEEYARNVPAAVDTFPKSVWHYLLENFDRYAKQSFSDPVQRAQAEQLLDWHVRFQVIDNSCMSLDLVSAKSWGNYSYNGESCQAHYNFKDGFSSATQVIRAEIGRKHFRFDKNVVKVTFVQDDRNGRSVRVRCADGQVFYGRHVICTFSMGSLKYGLTNGMFEPTLPKRTVQAIRDIGFQTINKLFMQFSDAWWLDMKGIQLIFKNEQHEVRIFILKKCFFPFVTKKKLCAE